MPQKPAELKGVVAGTYKVVSRCTQRKRANAVWLVECVECGATYEKMTCEIRSYMRKRRTKPCPNCMEIERMSKPQIIEKAESNEVLIPKLDQYAMDNGFKSGKDLLIHYKSAEYFTSDADIGRLLGMSLYSVFKLRKLYQVKSKRLSTAKIKIDNNKLIEMLKEGYRIDETAAYFKVNYQLVRDAVTSFSIDIKKEILKTLPQNEHKSKLRNILMPKPMIFDIDGFYKALKSRFPKPACEFCSLINEEKNMNMYCPCKWAGMYDDAVNINSAYNGIK